MALLDDAGTTASLPTTRSPMRKNVALAPCRASTSRIAPSAPGAGRRRRSAPRPVRRSRGRSRPSAAPRRSPTAPTRRGHARRPPPPTCRSSRGGPPGLEEGHDRAQRPRGRQRPGARRTARSRLSLAGVQGRRRRRGRYASSRRATRRSSPRRPRSRRRSAPATGPAPRRGRTPGAPRHRGRTSRAAGRAPRRRRPASRRGRRRTRPRRRRRGPRPPGPTRRRARGRCPPAAYARRPRPGPRLDPDRREVPAEPARTHPQLDRALGPELRPRDDQLGHPVQRPSRGDQCRLVHHAPPPSRKDHRLTRIGSAGAGVRLRRARRGSRCAPPSPVGAPPPSR